MKKVASLIGAAVLVSAGMALWFIPVNPWTDFPGWDWLFYPIRGVATFAGLTGAFEIIEWGFGKQQIKK